MTENSEELEFLESPHILEPQEVLKHYRVNPDYGLRDEQVSHHRELFGSHTFVKPKKASVLFLFVSQFDDLLVKILLSAAVISFLLTAFDPNEKAHISSFIEPIVILFILILNAIVGVWQEANAEKALEALKKLQPTLATCLRNGVWSTFDTDQLVVGDIVKVKNGDKIPTDLRVVRVYSTSLLVEQSQLTGESFLIYKTTEPLPKDHEKCELQSKTNILFGSTTVCSGSALGVVISTGMKTEIGAIQSAVIEASNENTTTPLQRMLNDFGTNLSKVITVICVIVWAINFRNFSDPVHGSTLRGCIYYFKIAIALAVAAIPEGLPAVITTCLALGTRKMAKRNAIVRKLPSIETLGCTTVICSDKTGTLTTNRMTSTVLNLFNDRNKLRYIHMPTNPKGSHKSSDEAQNIRVTINGFGERGFSVAESFDGPIEVLTHTLLKCASLCSDVTITTSSSYAKNRHSGDKDVNVNEYSGLLLEGEPTEVAIIEMVNNLGSFLINCDSTHLDAMGKQIFDKGSTKETKKKPKRRLLSSRSNVTVSSDEETTLPRDSSSSSSLKDDAATMGKKALKSPTPKSPTSRSPTPKSPSAKSSSKAQKQADKKTSSDETPTSLQYRKYLAKEATLEFCRTRKMMSVIVKDETKSSDNLYVYTKGAPESVLEICTSYMGPNGSQNKMTKEVKEEVLNQVKLLANEALRVLSFCYREASKKDLEVYHAISHAGSKGGGTSNFAKIEKDMVFLGVVGIMDPPRPEVKDSISKCMRAGIRVIMITGDNKLTAEAIARKVGIIRQTIATTLTNYNVEPSPTSNLTGKEFEALTNENQKKLLSNTCLVFSRTEPRHKQQIVSILKDLGEIVAMTGDGVNDAPALKMADIGISMGINGTEVAKEASDMILADDNFKTIVSAIEEGRCIYSNMKAFIRYLISSNIGEVVSIFMTAMLGIPEGMLPVQLLWVNLVTDGPPATALGFNPPDPLVMKKDPRSKDDKLIDKLTLFRYLLIGAYVGLATCGIFIMYFVRGVSPNEGNTLVTFRQLREWGNCSEWTDFAANNIYDMQESCDYFTVGKIKASTLSLTTLVVLEMFNAFNALSEDSSLLVMPPWKNLYLVLATLFSIGIHCLILYVPFLATLFNVVPLDLYDWKWVVIWSLPVVLIDELFKLFKRAYKFYTKPKLRHLRKGDRAKQQGDVQLKAPSSRQDTADADAAASAPKKKGPRAFWRQPSSGLGSRSFGDRFSSSLSFLMDRVSSSLPFSRSNSDSSNDTEVTAEPSDTELKDAPNMKK
ncbi:calcium-transporting ATPase [Theileria orientalis strain Shintoku]|uniref:P-type Ca(2+) transporter n=1 Tax=Theileria orientalis strain Shintoku TaxID=869250 RepID=J4C3D5_THEOR|nr:calcium-transporting ATPase [Theileria orientalis strain Shintoku]BAM40251.1 calcium-transporting ATPase [Theileria orientalis strain Shintoku]|eukprot:XP_009690552.1 calcium-transporting ATPase [Theileria orientalis strain Shintoku]